MTDKSKLADQQARGSEAQYILNHSLFKEFLAQSRNEFLEQFEKSGLDDDRSRLCARVALGVLGRIERLFTECKQNGEFATAQLNELKDETTKD